MPRLSFSLLAEPAPAPFLFSPRLVPWLERRFSFTLDPLELSCCTYRKRIKQCCGSGSGIRFLFDPGSGMGKKSRSASELNIPDHISESLETIFWVKILKFFAADAGIFFDDPGSGIRNGKNSNPGSGTNIPDPQHWNKTNIFFSTMNSQV
jgi:hypothetical protein